MANSKSKSKPDPEREERIHMEVVVDAYGPEERALGWHCYLQDQLQFPFTAICTAKRSISPLDVKDEIEIIDMASDDECAREMFVMIRWQKEGLAVPLMQLKPIAKRTKKPSKPSRIGTIGCRWGMSFDAPCRRR